MARSAKWKRVDTHDGVTLARSKFGRGTRGHAVIKVEGVLAADPTTVYQFLQLTTREGGKVNTVSHQQCFSHVHRDLTVRTYDHVVITNG